MSRVSFASLSAGSLAAAIALIVGALCLLLEGLMPWLSIFPKEWVLPATETVGTGVKSGLTFLKPAARMFSAFTRVKLVLLRKDILFFNKENFMIL